MSPKKQRLDKLLVDRQLARSREQARGMIMAGQVLVGGDRSDKPGSQVTADVEVRLIGERPPFVSRGGEKLAGALNHWGFNPAGMVCLDAGISTGGFTDCLLKRGAARVYGIDVGYGQVALALRDDARVTLFERANIRHFDAALIDELVDLTVADLSFISLTLVLEKLRELTRPGGAIIALVKPQFEVGKKEVGKGGVVRDPEKRQAAVDKVRARAESLGLIWEDAVASEIKGPKGNQEYLARMKRD